MAGLLRRIHYRLVFDFSEDQIDVEYEPETDDKLATVTLTSVTVQIKEFDGLIDGLNKIRDEIKAFEANDATVKTG